MRIQRRIPKEKCKGEIQREIPKEKFK